MNKNNSARKPGKRKRRLRQTFVFIAVAVVIGIVIIVFVNRSNRTEQRKPGEKVEGLTSKLSLNLPEDAPAPPFKDVTREARLDSKYFAHFTGPRGSQLPEDMGSGAAWGDYDNDGDEDLFVVGSGGPLTLPKEQRAPCVLFQNQGDGTFKKDDRFPDTRIIGMGASWGDFDGDGWLDLVVTGYNSLTLFHNREGTFAIHPKFPSLAGFWAGASWGDYDNDRDLDLYICGYVQYNEPEGKPPGSTRQYGRDVPYTLNPSSYEPQPNLLFRNNGDGTFTETAVKLGVANPKGRSLNALWQDFNDDGRLDLYIANDISDNVLYLNQNGSFKDISHAAWVADYRGAMGLADGDWNGDGDNDLFVTHWVAQENALYDSLLNDKVPDKTPGKTPVKSQTGEQSVPPVRFMDLADMAGLGQVALHKIGWGAEFLDFDADGWLDLLVTNGSTFETADTPPRLRPQKPFLFWNKNGKSFHNIAPLDAALDEEHVGRGLAVSDYNGDGYLDFLMVNHQEGIRLFRGEAVPETNWAIFILRSRSGSGGALNGRGEGAQLIATVNGRRLRRSGGGVSYLSQSSRRVHFGLGDAKTIDSLEVRWLGGGTDTYTNLAANNYWELEEGNPVPERRKVGRSENGKATRQEKTSEMDERQRITLFWERQRAAVQALKVEKNIDKAISLFKEALDLDPVHEDSLNYLGQAQVMKGELRGAIAAYERLTRVNSSSHRGFRQLGFLLARTGRTAEELLVAEVALERAFEINSEETGVLILLGEVDLMQGELEKARERLEQVCSSNPRSVTGLFLLGYIAWKKGESLQSRTFLTRAMEARAVDEKKPEGSTSEGDVQFKMHSNESLLSGFFNTKHNTFPLIYTNLDKELN